MPLNLEYVHPAPPNEELRGLDEDQRNCIMLVIQTWALLESLVQKLLATLAQSPLLLGQALTEDLGPDHRLKALRRLAASWLYRLNPDTMGEACQQLREVQEIAKWIATNKDSRNQLVHWQWLALDDKQMLCFKYTMRPPPGGAEVDTEQFAKVTTDNVLAFAEETHAITDRMTAADNALATLPTWT